MRGALWYWHRLRAMDPAEAWQRIAEKMRHVTRPLALDAMKNERLKQKPGDCPALPARDEAPALLKQSLANDAVNLLAGKWLLYGWQEVQVLSPPDWHRDYGRGTSVPVMGGKLNHRALPGEADARNIWEINRWAEPVRLAMHGWLNDDAGASQQAQGWLADWVTKNPVGQGINWSSALEGGLRLINFCWFDAIIAKMGDGSLEIAKTQRALADKIVPAHVWWVKRYLSFGSSANNHRLGELTGLLLAVKRWPELEKTAGSAEELWEQIEACVLSQFAEDGGNLEQALHYHLFAFEMAQHACRAMDVTEGPVIERLRRAAEFFARMSHPQEPWDYGDSDDAQIVPMTVHRENAIEEWSAWMTGILPVGEGTAEESGMNYWLGRWGHSDDAGQNARATHRLQACATRWWIAPESGMAVIERDGWKVRVDASPLGFGRLAAHGHCDALHVSIWDGQHALVIDPGTGGYFESKELRADLASWNAHNGPQPAGGFRTPRRAGTFLWAEPHARPVPACGDDSLRITFNHEGVQLIRTVRIDRGLVMIEDSISSHEAIRARWTFAPGQEVEKSKNAISISRDGKVWHLETSGDAAVTTESVSRSFGSLESTAALEVTGSHKIMLSISRGAESGPELHHGLSHPVASAHGLKPATAFSNT